MTSLAQHIIILALTCHMAIQSKSRLRFALLDKRARVCIGAKNRFVDKCKQPMRPHKSLAIVSNRAKS